VQKRDVELACILFNPVCTDENIPGNTITLYIVKSDNVCVGIVIEVGLINT
jgi:hypothetical protein